MGIFQSTKKFGPISTSHRQWRDDGHCSRVHGYGRYVQLTFAGELDSRQWVYDFGDAKFIKKFLEDSWDHRTLIASDDPELELLQALHDKKVIDINVMDVSRGWGPGIEASSKYIFDNIQPIVFEKTNFRVRISKVEVWEHELNSAMYIPGAEEYEAIIQEIKKNEVSNKEIMKELSKQGVLSFPPASVIVRHLFGLDSNLGYNH